MLQTGTSVIRDCIETKESFKNHSCDHFSLKFFSVILTAAGGTLTEDLPDHPFEKSLIFQDPSVVMSHGGLGSCFFYLFY